MRFKSLVSYVLVLGVVGLCATSACSNGGGAASGAGGSGGSGGSGKAGAGSGGVLATGGAIDSGAAGGASGSASSDSGGTVEGGSQYPNVGVCGRRAKATADATSFDGYEERYLIGEEGFGTAICVVRFDLQHVGDAPSGCTVCSWTHLLEYSNPSVISDTDGVCAKSDLGLDEAGIAKIVGSRLTIGFAKQLGGAHGSARMTYVDATGEWDVVGNATWNETSKAFSSDYREGLCNYGP
jgi:hypothetical protein